MNTETGYQLQVWTMLHYFGDRRRKYDPALERWDWKLHHEFDSWDEAMDCVADPEWDPEMRFRIVEVTRKYQDTGVFGDYNPELIKT